VWLYLTDHAAMVHSLELRGGVLVAKAWQPLS
jgi:hypothetical protein